MRLDYLRPLLLIAVVACGGDDDGSPDDDSSDDGSQADASPADAGRPDAGPDAAPLDGGNTGEACGGLLNVKCLETHFCDWETDSCGSGDEQGVCQPRPTECEPAPQVCGCDAVRYEGECEAHKAGSDIAAISICGTDT